MPANKMMIATDKIPIPGIYIGLPFVGLKNSKSLKFKALSTVAKVQKTKNMAVLNGKTTSKPLTK
jgi:hypothetical protein